MANRIKEKEDFLDKAANWVMWWIGSIPSLIVHTIIFIMCFLLPIFNIVSFDKMLLSLTTVLSLEAIYLAIFIQMGVNRSHEHIEDIREDVTEIQEDIEDIQEDIEEISDDIDEISEDIEDIQEDIEEISEDIEEISEDIEEISEDDDDEDHSERARTVMLKSNVSSNKNEIKNLKDKIALLMEELEKLKKDDEATSNSKGNDSVEENF